MSASTPKRVSFGSGQDSIVETLIIDESTIMPVEDPSFDHNLSNHTLPPAILEVKQEFGESISSQGVEMPTNKAGKPAIHVTFSDNNIEHTLASSTEPLAHSPPSQSPAISPSPSSSSCDRHPIIKTRPRSQSMESQENPFTADGELSKKAEFILRHSTISRTEVRINDPDAEVAEPEQIEMIEAQSSSPTQAAPPSDSNGVNSDQTKLKENGKPDSTTTSEPATANATEQPKDAKPKTKKCKCCVIQ